MDSMQVEAPSHVDPFPQKKVIFLDFDGVLAIPYTNPEQPYPHLGVLLQDLQAKGFTLCVASFNPMARPSLERWGWTTRFKAIRCGSNWYWDDQIVDYSDLPIENDLCKSKQIADMLDKELKELGLGPEHCAFFDDTPANLDAVRRKLPDVSCVHVTADKGLQWEHILEAHKSQTEKKIEECMNLLRELHSQQKETLYQFYQVLSRANPPIIRPMFIHVSTRRLSAVLGGRMRHKQQVSIVWSLCLAAVQTSRMLTELLHGVFNGSDFTKGEGESEGCNADTAWSSYRIMSRQEAIAHDNRENGQSRKLTLCVNDGNLHTWPPATPLEQNETFVSYINANPSKRFSMAVIGRSNRYAYTSNGRFGPFDMAHYVLFDIDITPMFS